MNTIPNILFSHSRYPFICGRFKPLYHIAHQSHCLSTNSRSTHSLASQLFPFYNYMLPWQPPPRHIRISLPSITISWCYHDNCTFCNDVYITGPFWMTHHWPIKMTYNCSFKTDIQLALLELYTTDPFRVIYNRPY